MTSSGRLAAKRALVTGGGSGIGRAVAHRLATEGASVGVLDVRDGAADEVAATIVHKGGTALGVGCDVGNEESVAAATEVVASRFSGLDTVVACAGIAYAEHTESMPLDAWETMLRVNLTGVFLTVKHALPHLIAAGGGSITTIGSVASLVAAGRCSAYDASKGGVLQFTRHIAAEYVDHGIRANCVCPGLVATDLVSNTRSIARNVHRGGKRRPAAVADRVDIPISRASDPSEIASSVTFLSSDDATFITGIALPVDGGYTAV